MAAPTEAPDVQTVADEVGAALADHWEIPTFSSRPGGLTLAQAYRVTALLRAAFEARGEAITGRKIGFTNREMWKVYGVQSPIWGHITNRTTHELASTDSPHRGFRRAAHRAGNHLRPASGALAGPERSRVTRLH
jgi:2-keto-4-pentenoate hydratase